MENLEQVTIISDLPLNELYKKYSFSKAEVSICEGVGSNQTDSCPFPIVWADEQVECGRGENTGPAL